MQISQAAFARLMDVSRKTVTVWKKQGRIIMVGEHVDVEASRERMARYSTSGSKAFKGATKTLPESNGASPEGNAVAPLAEYPASMTVMVSGGAGDLAVILLRAGLPRDRAQAVVDEWFGMARRSAAELLEEDLDPPPGFDRWIDHPAFQEGWLASWAGWSEIEAEAARPSGQEG
jgi:hypothetical protein